MNVYLAGPISRVTFRQATEWRDEATRLLNEMDIQTLDPMYGKQPPAGGQDTPIDQGDSLGLSPEETFERDMSDITNSDVLLVNLEDFVGSIGSPFEIGRAWAEGKPVVVFGADQFKTHPFSVAFTHMADDLKGAIGAIEHLEAFNSAPEAYQTSEYVPGF